MNDDEFARWLAERDPEADFATAARTTEQLAPTLIGLDTAAATQRAQERGVTIRIVRGEGAGKSMTRDRRPNRINVAVEHGRVVSAEVG
jgi:hypothetical protein